MKNMDLLFLIKYMVFIVEIILSSINYSRPHCRNNFELSELFRSLCRNNFELNKVFTSTCRNNFELNSQKHTAHYAWSECDSAVVFFLNYSVIFYNEIGMILLVGVFMKNRDVEIFLSNQLNYMKNLRFFSVIVKIFIFYTIIYCGIL